MEIVGFYPASFVSITFPNFIQISNSLYSNFASECADPISSSGMGLNWPKTIKVILFSIVTGFRNLCYRMTSPAHRGWFRNVRWPNLGWAMRGGWLRAFGKEIPELFWVDFFPAGGDDVNVKPGAVVASGVHEGSGPEDEAGTAGVRGRKESGSFTTSLRCWIKLTAKYTLLLDFPASWANTSHSV